MDESSEWALLARYLSDECSAEEKAQVEALIAADPEKERLVESMRTAWQTPPPQSAPSDVNRLWDEVAQKAGLTDKSIAFQPRNRRGLAQRVIDWYQPKLYPVRRYAAAAVLFIVASVAYFAVRDTGILPWHKQDPQWVTLAIESGTHGELTLSDGTLIRLDAGSVLQYPKSFAGDERAVELSGEGYFEVASNPQKPFVVRANHAVVKVLGTQFNLRAWQAEQRVTVAVAEGRVALGSAEKEETAVEIALGQMSTLAQSGPPSQPQRVDIDKHLGWMHREAFFDSAPLREILYQLERWYNVQFILEDASIAAEKLTLHIEAQSLDDVLELISALTDLHYQRSGNSIHLQPHE